MCYCQSIKRSQDPIYQISFELIIFTFDSLCWVKFYFFFVRYLSPLLYQFHLNFLGDLRIQFWCGQTLEQFYTSPTDVFLSIPHNPLSPPPSLVPSELHYTSFSLFLCVLMSIHHNTITRKEQPSARTSHQYGVLKKDLLYAVLPCIAKSYFRNLTP